MPRETHLVPMGQRDVQMHDEVPVARRVGEPLRSLASLNDAREGHRRELALDLALRKARPHRGTRWRVLTHRERVEQLETSGVGQGRERVRGALV